MRRRGTRVQVRHLQLQHVRRGGQRFCQSRGCEAGARHGRTLQNADVSCSEPTREGRPQISRTNFSRGRRGWPWPRCPAPVWPADRAYHPPHPLFRERRSPVMGMGSSRTFDVRTMNSTVMTSWRRCGCFAQQWRHDRLVAHVRQWNRCSAKSVSRLDHRDAVRRHQGLDLRRRRRHRADAGIRPAHACTRFRPDADTQPAGLEVHLQR